MAASAFDSEVFRDLFSTPAMRRIFSDRARVQYYLDIEAALARVQARLGIIPVAAADEIVRHCDAAAFEGTLIESSELTGRDGLFVGLGRPDGRQNPGQYQCCALHHPAPHHPA